MGIECHKVTVSMPPRWGLAWDMRGEGRRAEANEFAGEKAINNAQMEELTN